MKDDAKKTNKVRILKSNSAQRIGKRVRFFRCSKGYSQENFSELCGVSPRYISELERGEANATINLLESVATALDVELDDLFNNQHEASRSELMGNLLNLLENAEEEQVKTAYRVITAIMK